jgi:hypothetical protein
MLQHATFDVIGRNRMEDLEGDVKVIINTVLSHAAKDMVQCPALVNNTRF